MAQADHTWNPTAQYSVATTISMGITGIRFILLKHVTCDMTAGCLCKANFWGQEEDRNVGEA